MCIRCDTILQSESKKRRHFKVDSIRSNWDELYAKCNMCTACPLHETKTNTVFGKGCKTADILFVGEAPGEKEDLQGEPFVGASGKLLDKYFEAVDLTLDDIYVANILKCRPPKNRDPLPAEEDACIGYLREQFKLIEPKMIVCLGELRQCALSSQTSKSPPSTASGSKKADIFSRLYSIPRRFCVIRERKRTCSPTLPR